MDTYVAIEADDTDELEAFKIVNGMDCNAYTQHVEEIYTAAKTAYDEYILRSANETFEKLNNKLKRLWNKIEKEINPAQIEKDLERVTDITHRLSQLMEMKRSHSGVSWDSLITEIEEILEDCETLEDNANLKMRSHNVSVTSSVSDLPSTIEQDIITTTAPISTTAVTSLNVVLPPASSFPTTQISSIPPIMSTGVGNHLYASLCVPSTSVMTSVPQTASPLGSSLLYQPGLQQTIPPLVSSLVQQSALQTSVVPSDIKVRRAELPHFSGKRKHWPEFKTLWPKMAVPSFTSREMLASELRRSCENGEAAKIIAMVPIVGPEAVDVMWQRLVDHYENAAAAVKEVMKTLQELKPVRPEDYRYLTEFVDIVESCYTQLATINHLDCISILDVDNLSRLLPVSAKEGWHERYQMLAGDAQLHPFKDFTVYLLERRRAVARLVESQPPCYRKKEVVTHSGSTVVEGRPQRSSFYKPKCAVHKEDVNHTTENCRAFNEMNVEDRREALKSVNACYRCFLYHPRGNCRNYRYPCDKCGQNNHHTLLCYQEDSGQDEETVHTSGQEVESVHTGPNNINIKSMSPRVEKVSMVAHTTHHCDNALYAIFSVPVVGSKNRSTVFTDDGSDASYITYEAAKRLGARKLKKYMLELTTTGRKEPEFESTLYELDIVTRSGKIVTIQMFGMQKITDPISRLDLSVLSRLFPDYDTTLLQRNSSGVDILLGSNFFGLHPKNELCTAGDNLSIMEGPLGVCVMGSHPLLHGELNMDSTVTKELKDVNISKAAYHSRLSTAHPTGAPINPREEEREIQTSPQCSQPAHALSQEKNVDEVINEEVNMRPQEESEPGIVYTFKFGFLCLGLVLLSTVLLCCLFSVTTYDAGGYKRVFNQSVFIQYSPIQDRLTS